MRETPQCVELFTTLLNPEIPHAEVDASAAMIAAARLTRWRRNQPCDAVVVRGAVACVLSGAVRKFARDEGHGGILRRIEEKLDHLLGSRDDDWHQREWAPLGDPRPRFFEGPPVAGWDSSSAGARFDRVDVGSVGSDGVDPVPFDPEQGPFFGARSSAREYYLAMRARQQKAAGDGANSYADYRRRRKAELDREYADYCRDRQECFDRDFDAGRQKRGGPAPSADEPSKDERAASAESTKERL